MTYNQARIVVGLWAGCWSWPVNITASERARYIYGSVEIFFNTLHGVNMGHVENVRDDNHRIIAGCMYRPGLLGGAE